MNIKIKNHLSITIPLLAIFVGILVYIYFMQIREFRQSIFEQITINTAKHERDINSWFAQKMMLVDMISDDLRHFNITEINDLGKFFSQVAETNPSVAAIYLGMHNKSIVFNDNLQAPPGFDPTIRTWYIHANKSRGKTVASEPYIDILTGKQVITLCKTVQLNNGLNGVIGIDIYLDDVTNLVNAIHPYFIGTSFLLSGDGNIVTHANANFLPKSTDEASGRAFFTKYSDIETNDVRNIRTANNNVFLKQMVIDGVEKYVATIKISDIDWFYGSEIPVSAFNKDLIRITVPLIIILIIGIIISISGIILNQRRIRGAGK